MKIMKDNNVWVTSPATIPSPSPRAPTYQKELLLLILLNLRYLVTSVAPDALTLIWILKL